MAQYSYNPGSTETRRMFYNKSGQPSSMSVTQSGSHGFSFVFNIGIFIVLGWLLLGSTAIWDHQTMILVVIGVIIYFMMRR